MHGKNSLKRKNPAWGGMKDEAASQKTDSCRFHAH